MFHLQAKCVMTGPGQSKCVCDDGWRGDGMQCYPQIPCTIHNDCHAKAKCVVTGVGQVRNMFTVHQHCVNKF